MQLLNRLQQPASSTTLHQNEPEAPLPRRAQRVRRT